MISVVICTYNRCESLRDTLNSLLNQECNGSFDYEVIPVDNNSKDKTKEVVESYMLEFQDRLKYLFEPQPGKSYALNAGIKEAKGEVIAFTDDDCMPQKQWLYKIWQMFKDNSNLDGILGEAIWDNGKKMYREKGILRGNGLNMAFRKSSLQDLGGFDENLGPGSPGCSSEDRDLIYRAKRQNKTVIISDEIMVVHKSRANSQEELRLMYRDCQGRMIAWLKHVIKGGDIFALKNIFWNIEWAFLGLLKEIKNRNKEGMKLKFIQLSAMLIGIFKGMWLWLSIVPIKNYLFRKRRIAFYLY